MSSGRPERGEFAEYADDDIAFVEGDDACAALSAQAERLIALLAPLTDEGVRERRYAPGKWTLKEVVGHLVDDERIFAYRMLCVARGESRPLPGFDEGQYVRSAHFESMALAALLSEYRATRVATLAFLSSLTAEEWVRRGIVNDYSASVRGLAFHIAGHELRHVRSLQRLYLAEPTDATRD